MSALYPPTLIRSVRLVPVGGVAAPPGEVDVRIRDGVVREVAPRLDPEGQEQVHDGAGRWAIPGLWDQHVHLRQWGQHAGRIDTSGTASAAEVIDRVARHIADLPADQRDSVVQGWGHRSATWPRPATVAELDAVSGEHPVVLVAGDAHHGWLNSRALALLGAPPADGVVAETDWYPLFVRLGELPGADADAEEGLARAARRAAAKGVVGIVELELAANYTDWPARFARGVTELRVRGATYADGLDAVIAAGLRAGDPLGAGEGLLRMGPLKVISDGSLGTRTAHCCQPYVDDPGSDHPHGRPNLSAAELTELTARATAHGLEVAVHAIGDAAVATALDAFERTGARGSIEHAQLIQWPDIPRLAALGLAASVQPHHLWDDRDTLGCSWPDREERCFPFRALLDAGARVVLGSDAPVSPLDPWLAMAAAVHRSADDRPPWHPEQAMTVAEALAASTDGRPTIGPGRPGDLVLLDVDPLAAPGDPQDSGAAAAYLMAVPVAATFVGGRATHLQL